MTQINEEKNVFENTTTEEQAMQDVENVQTTSETTEQKKNSDDVSVGLDSDVFEPMEWINTPKEIGDETKEFELLDYVKRKAKEVPKSDKVQIAFWSGLTPQDVSLKDAKADPEKYPEHVLIGTNKENYRMSSWDEFFKFVTFAKYCRQEGIMLKGMMFKAKRVNKGVATAGQNFEFYFSRKDDKYVVKGKDNKITKL